MKISKENMLPMNMARGAWPVARGAWRGGWHTVAQGPSILNDFVGASILLHSTQICWPDSVVDSTS